MLIMCEPLVWFCIDFKIITIIIIIQKKRSRICIRNSAIKMQHGANWNIVLMLASGVSVATE